MGRRRKTLLERVEADAFRADRYASLLLGESLPEEPPAWADSRLWQLLREEQDWYRVPLRRWHRPGHAAAFSKLVRALHGGRVPRFAREEERRRRRRIRQAEDRAQRERLEREVDRILSSLRLEPGRSSSD